MTIKGKWKNLVRFDGLAGINVATIKFGVGEPLVQIFSERLLQCCIPEVSKTERSQYTYLVPARIQFQQSLLGTSHAA